MSEARVHELRRPSRFFASSKLRSARRLHWSAPEARRQHADVSAIILIILAEQTDEVMFFVTDRDQHIDRHSDREQQMPDGHLRRGPEGEEESQIERMAHP